MAIPPGLLRVEARNGAGTPAHNRNNIAQILQNRFVQFVRIASIKICLDCE